MDKSGRRRRIDRNGGERRAAYDPDMSTVDRPATPPTDSTDSRSGAETARPFDVEAIRSEFPILSRTVHGKPLTYLDNAATKHKPDSVIREVEEHYREHNANVHRGVHALAEESTRAYEAARTTVARFLNAPDERGCIFTSGVTDSINLVARAWAERELKPGDRILLTEMEHHSNIVPWQIAAKLTGAEILVARVADDGSLDLEDWKEKLASGRVRLASTVAVSNAMGTVNPIREICGLARDAGALTFVDAAQASAFMPIDVQEIGCDFLGFTSHKLFGPTGTGVLWGDFDRLSAMHPYRGGGDMIDAVSFTATTYAKPPARFEAGTPNIAGVIGMAAAIRWLEGVDRDGAHAHELDLSAYGQEKLSQVDGLKPIGTAPGKAPVFSFVLDWGHAYDVGAVLDHMGVAIRTGHHCTQPLMERFGVSATMRASCTIYSTRAEIDRLVEGLSRAKEMLG